MTKIERRRTVVRLYPGNVAQELLDLRDQFKATLDQDVTGPRRSSTKSKAPAKAIEHDKRQDEIEASATEVVLLEITGTDYQRIADEHPPREGNARDLQAEVNMKTFPLALARESVADRELEIDALSLAHQKKLSTAAWNLHNADDSFPKVSLVSLLKQARAADSAQPSDSE